MGVEVPARAAAGAPDRALHPALHVGVPGVLRLPGDLHAADPALAHLLDRGADVGDLALDDEDHRGVAEAGVGADDLEQVGEAGDRGALVRRHAALAPRVGQGAPVATLHVLRDRLLGRVEAGGHDDRVDLALGAVGRHDAGRGDRADPVGDQVDVVGVEGRVVVVGDQDALAADLEVRRDRLAQGRVGDAARDVLQRQLLRRGGQLRVDREARDEALASPVDARAVGPLHERDVPEGEPLDAGVVAVVARHHPGSGALVDVEVRDLLGDLGHDLDRRRAGADHRDALAGQVVVVVPARRVEDLAGEGVDAVDLGQSRLGEAAGAGDQHVGHHVAVVGADAPHLLVLVPGGVLDGDPEPEPVEDAGLAGDPLEVGQDLRLGRERPRPVGVGREAERVELAGHVARGARVGVVAPGAADGAALVDDEEVAEPVLVELDGGAEAREPGADDERVHALGQVGRGKRGRGGRRGHASNPANLLNARQ